MLKIRLQRVGRKNDPSFRIVVMPHQKDSQSGKVTEILGSYNARHGKPQVNAERVKHWLAQGALASGTVHNILVKQKVITGKTVNVLPKRKAVEKKPEEASAEAPKAEIAPEKIEEKAEEKPEEKAEVEVVEVKAEETKPEETVTA
ncbi:MAG: 30S ribosomal protein S16 [Patescibacteria group bacterium]